MIVENKNLYIIAGCNGAGKTTASFTILPEIIDCDEFINADEIAKGLSPFHPETVAFAAGKIMLNRINTLLATHKTFAFETTLATKSYKNYIIRAKKQGYKISLLFFWLNSVELAKERVKNRVNEGGHHIPENVIERRYKKGIQNLFDVFLNLVDNALIIDNSYGKQELVAEKNGSLKVYREKKFKAMKNLGNGK